MYFPTCVGQAYRQYLCLVDDVVDTENTEEVERLFSALDGGSGSDSDSSDHGGPGDVDRDECKKKAMFFS